MRGMKSMTGYGRGECAQDGFKITVELGAVNRRQSEISVNLPRELEMLEAQVRDAINAQVARGRVTARISIHAAKANFPRKCTSTNRLRKLTRRNSANWRSI